MQGVESSATDSPGVLTAKLDSQFEDYCRQLRTQPHAFFVVLLKEPMGFFNFSSGSPPLKNL